MTLRLQVTSHTTRPTPRRKTLPWVGALLLMNLLASVLVLRILRLYTPRPALSVSSSHHWQYQDILPKQNCYISKLAKKGKARIFHTLLFPQENNFIMAIPMSYIFQSLEFFPSLATLRHSSLVLLALRLKGRPTSQQLNKANASHSR